MKLTLRERMLIIGAGVFLLAVGLYFSADYIRENLKTGREKLTELDKTQVKLESLAREYQTLLAYRNASTNRSLNDMVPRIEGRLNGLGLYKDALLSTTDSTVENKYLRRQVKISFKEITGESVLKLMQEIEGDTDFLLRIENFDSRSLLKKEGYYKVSLTISAYQQKGKE